MYSNRTPEFSSTNRWPSSCPFIPGMLTSARNRSGAAPGIKDFIAFYHKTLARQAPRRIVVFHHEAVPDPLERSGQSSWHLQHFRSSLTTRQVDLSSCALAKLAGNRDAPSTLA